MTAVDLVADSSGLLVALNNNLVALSEVCYALLVAVCVLVAVECARGVMRR